MSQASASRQVVINGPWAARARGPVADVALTDEALVELLERDVRRGAAEIFDRFAPTVNRLVWRLLGADAEHDDLVQHVFCKIIMHAAKLRDPSRLAAWVQITTINTVYEELRRREIRRLFLRERVPPELHRDATQQVEARDLLLRTGAVLERISAKDRIVFVLHVVEGKPLEEIADLCGCSIRTTKRRLASANRRFKQLVSGQPDLAQLFAGRREEP
jgi:RNA polymerase sigma-70 factor, ECF subfamily